jgi:hypothetical protein
MAKEAKTFGDKRFTLQGRIFYPNLLTPKAKDNGREVFDCMFSWKNDQNAQVLQEINAYLMQGVNDYHSGINPAVLVNPIKDFHKYIPQSGKANPEFLRDCKWLNAQTGKEYPPQVVKKNLQPVTALDAAEIYSGRNAIINISFYVILPKQGVTGSKRGFGVNLHAVLLDEGGAKEGGSSAPVDVNKVFGQFASESVSPFAQQTQQQAPSNNNGGGGFI